MALKSGLSLYCYTIAASGQPNVGPINYGGQIESLAFTTVAPGGYGQLTARLRVKSTLLPRPELALFARVALMAGPLTLFLGEMMQPELGYEEGTGEYITISALGAGNALRDDPISSSYILQTAQQIAISQMNFRVNYSMPVDTDTALLFPDNPSAQWTLSFTNRTMEEVLSDIAILAGDYQWGTWVHSLHAQGIQPGTAHKDAAGFPTAQISVVLRDATTTHYTARVAAKDVAGWRISPSADRAYNVIAIDYYDASQNPPVGTVTKSDSRLAGTGAQNTAPFRRRRFSRDLSGTTSVSKSMATSIANTYLAQMENVTNKVELRLRALRDAQGNDLPLYLARADRNIAVPEMAVRGQQLPTSYTPGVNQFYVVQTRYDEDTTGAALLTIEADNYWDRANMLISRLQLWADRNARSSRTTGLIQASGASETGSYGGQFTATGAGQVFTFYQPFRTIMQTMTSTSQVTLTPNDTSNSSTLVVQSVTPYGFKWQITSLGAGFCWNFGTYATSGN